ncbi:hypothetical protein [Sphingobium cupriresistens]|uniref:Uncharacterized protein n=1 Tax=Sphingobium cupriresistens TaxID=1132417 RepID=A0A8G1ZH72_9SPHN|nr:hypothetical protein [Sphingobium cupriresistens]RYM10172.1 hypothetical protein EWH12_12785 [Sphingobium cupriresistens]
MDIIESDGTDSIFMTRPKPARAGLNNQKMCLFGLLSFAKQKGGGAILPSKIIDFSAKKSELVEHSWVDIAEVFDIGKVKSWMQSENLSRPSSPGRIMVPWKQCFDYGCEAIADPDNVEFFGRFLGALRASPPLRDLASNISKYLGNNTAAVQLRVEEDWQHHARKLLEKKPGGTFLLTPYDILIKVANTPELKGYKRWLVFCDQKAMPWTTEEIKDEARDRLGIDLIFKSDLMDKFRFPESSIKNANLDFEIGLLTPAYVGLHQSSFSNMLYRTAKLLLESEPAHYLYSVPGPFAKKRVAM